MTNPSMDSHDAESQPLLGRNDNVNTPLTGHCYTETDADATTPATASPGDHDFDFDPLGDVDNPLEWPIALKWGIVTLLALMAFTVYVYPLSFPSSPLSGGVVQPPLHFLSGNIFSPCCHHLPALHLCTGIPVPATPGSPRSGVVSAPSTAPNTKIIRFITRPPAAQPLPMTPYPGASPIHNTRQDEPSPPP